MACHPQGKGVRRSTGGWSSRTGSPSQRIPRPRPRSWKRS